MSLASLASLPAASRDDAGLTQAFGNPAALVAVPESARPSTIAALAQLGERSPLLVATPTGTDAGQLYDDLCQFMPRRLGRAVPGVGDAAVRAGQPERGDDGPAAGGAVALRDGNDDRGRHGRDHRRRRPRPAAAPRPRGHQRRADHGPPNDVIDPDALLDTLVGVRLPPRGAGRASRRGRPARRDHRRVPVHRRRADPHRPVGRRGRPPDRVQRQRPAQHRRPHEVQIFPARELLPDDDVREPGRRAGRRGAVGTRAVGASRRGHRCSTAWRAGCRGSSTGTRCSPTCCPPPAKVVLVEPRRMRDRANDLLAEEDDLARTLASTWARDADRGFPRLHADTDRLLGATQACGRSARPRSTRRADGAGHRMGPRRRRR